MKKEYTVSQQVEIYTYSMNKQNLLGIQNTKKSYLMREIKILLKKHKK